MRNPERYNFKVSRMKSPLPDFQRLKPVKESKKDRMVSYEYILSKGWRRFKEIKSKIN